jgi:hypothetical protein
MFADLMYVGSKKKIRIASQDLNDTVAWHYEKNGLFSVKSAYKLATALKREVPPASSKAPDGKRMLWQNI